uniref:Expressed protein n=1 Tax=Schizophyllum commune (strain H4-8 / FGSC 9210) TaxID=578458 RepID=D8Q2Q6_SCHCM
MPALPKAINAEIWLSPSFSTRQPAACRIPSALKRPKTGFGGYRAIFCDTQAAGGMRAAPRARYANFQFCSYRSTPSTTLRRTKGRP